MRASARLGRDFGHLRDLDARHLAREHAEGRLGADLADRLRVLAVAALQLRLGPLHLLLLDRHDAAGRPVGVVRGGHGRRRGLVRHPELVLGGAVGEARGPAVEGVGLRRGAAAHHQDGAHVLGAVGAGVLEGDLGGGADAAAAGDVAQVGAVGRRGGRAGGAGRAAPAGAAGRAAAAGLAAAAGRDRRPLPRAGGRAPTGGPLLLRGLAGRQGPSSQPDALRPDLEDAAVEVPVRSHVESHVG